MKTLAFHSPLPARVPRPRLLAAILVLGAAPGRCRRPSRRSCRTARLSVQHALLVDEESLHLYATRVGRPSQRDAPLPRRRWSRGLARNSPP
jgi:hypothetical protein